MFWLFDPTVYNIVTRLGNVLSQILWLINSALLCQTYNSGTYFQIGIFFICPTNIEISSSQQQKDSDKIKKCNRIVQLSFELA